VAVHDENGRMRDSLRRHAFSRDLCQKCLDFVGSIALSKHHAFVPDAHHLTALQTEHPTSVVFEAASGRDVASVPLQERGYLIYGGHGGKGSACASLKPPSRVEPTSLAPNVPDVLLEDQSVQVCKWRPRSLVATCLRPLLWLSSWLSRQPNLAGMDGNRTHPRTPQQRPADGFHNRPQVSAQASGRRPLTSVGGCHRPTEWLSTWLSEPGSASARSRTGRISCPLVSRRFLSCPSVLSVTRRRVLLCPPGSSRFRECVTNLSHGSERPTDLTR